MAFTRAVSRSRVCPKGEVRCVALRFRDCLGRETPARSPPAGLKADLPSASSLVAVCRPGSCPIPCRMASLEADRKASRAAPAARSYAQNRVLGHDRSRVRDREDGRLCAATTPDRRLGPLAADGPQICAARSAPGALVRTPVDRGRAAALAAWRQSVQAFRLGVHFPAHGPRVADQTARPAASMRPARAERASSDAVFPRARAVAGRTAAGPRSRIHGAEISPALASALLCRRREGRSPCAAEA